MGRLNEFCVLNTHNKSHAVTAELVVPDGGAHGVLVNQGGIPGGWSLYLNDGRLAYCYNLYGIQRFTVTADQPVPAGEHQARMEFTYDGGGVGKGGTATLYLDGTQVASEHVDRTHPFGFSMDETTDVGKDTGSPVTNDHPVGDNAFTGTIKAVRIELGTDSHDHLIDPQHLVQYAMTRQ